jgi:hypothetical protein
MKGVPMRASLAALALIVVTLFLAVALTKPVLGAGPAKARFVDNGDGTVTDNQTGLMWEQKTDANANDFYSWTYSDGPPSGNLFTVFLGTMTCAASRDGTCGFAGHIDWRIPTIAELRSIVDCTKPNCLDPIFGPIPTDGFQLTWSSTTVVQIESTQWCCVWTIDATGNPFAQLKVYSGAARAVRGGR